MTSLNKKAIFHQDYEGIKSFRIPSMITTQKGTIIAGIDARIVASADNPNEIEAAIRRSFDNGETWKPIQHISSYPGEGLDGAAAMDTSLLEDKETGTIFMIYCHTPGGIGLWQSVSGTGFTEDGKRKLFDKDGNEYYLEKDKTVSDSQGNTTGYTVDDKGFVFKNNQTQGNIYYKQGVHPNESLLEKRTSFLQLIKSEDDGATWSEPIELNPMVKEEWMCFIGSGPGQGIQLQVGKYKGRLVFPIYFSNEGGHLSSACIYSDDHGRSWKCGESPNDGRILEGETLTAKTVNENKQYLTESQVIELPSGELRYFLRNHYTLKRTAIATSHDGGEKWGEVSFDMSLVDPISQSSVIRYPSTGDGKTRVIFSNANHETDRKIGTIRLSEDGGKTWKYSKVVEEGMYGYSCLTVLQNGEIGLLYEKMNDPNNWSDMDITFTTFTLDWIKS